MTSGFKRVKRIERIAGIAVAETPYRIAPQPVNFASFEIGGSVEKVFGSQTNRQRPAFEKQARRDCAAKLY
jgi:hypothetical protein